MLVPRPDSSHTIHQLASLAEPRYPPADIRLADTVDTTRRPGRSPTQGHLLSQRGDPSSRSPEILLTPLRGGHSGRPLSTGGHLPRLLHRTDPTPPVPRGPEHIKPPRRSTDPIQQGKGPLMEGSNSTNSSRPGEEWILHNLFPGTQETRRPQAHLESKVLQLKCLQDFVQDGDSELHHSHHVPTPVVGQRGPRGCFHIGVVPHTTSSSDSAGKASTTNLVYCRSACHRPPESS